MPEVAMQLQSSLEQNDALQSERASLTNSLRKLEAFKRNLLHTLQASDVVVRRYLPLPAICSLPAPVLSSHPFQQLLQSLAQWVLFDWVSAAAPMKARLGCYARQLRPPRRLFRHYCISTPQEEVQSEMAAW